VALADDLLMIFSHFLYIDALLISMLCNFKQMAKRSSLAVSSSSKYCASVFFIWLVVGGLLCAAHGRHKVSAARTVSRRIIV
jgi:hypothetical protein